MSRLERFHSILTQLNHSMYVPVAEVDCSTDNGGCDQICVDSSGTVECQCEDGYDLSGRSSCIGSYIM